MTETDALHSGTSGQRVVVVGAGECGTRAAMALRERGFDGSITLIGREEVHAYERPPLSKASLAADDADLVHPWTPEQLAEAGVSLRLGADVTGIDRSAQTVRTSDGPLPYDRLLLAMGARPRRLDLEHVLYLRTHEDATALRALVRPGGRMLVIGAGFIGLEIAAAARERGMEVVVVESADRALSRMVPAVIAERVVALHHEHGVPIRTGTTVAAVHREGDRLRAALSDGEELVVDAVVAGVGAAPSTEIASDAGLLVEDGIVVDEQLRTSDPRIWAAGDCATFPDARSGRRVRVESWRNAHDQALTVAASMTGGEEPHVAVPWFWSDQYDQMLQTAGLPGPGEHEVVRVREDGSLLHFGLDAAGRLVDATSLGRGPVVAKDIRVAERLIGAGARPDPAGLADPGVPLRSLLA
ncbi:NAD(P)/FAD-dependent oxidoreductase [Janibacter sp. GS2]|uniref:NAD(P)/FAD-dependent oxidoreductase n=1 Tax=Janibacter sp. GS2 TaxID=3442646 RepID=UPI003EBD2248